MRPRPPVPTLRAGWEWPRPWPETALERAQRRTDGPMPAPDLSAPFPCLACSRPTVTGTFCSPECEAHPDAGDRLTNEVREVLIEALAWDAWREARRTGVWH